MAEAKITLETIANDEGLKNLNKALAEGAQAVQVMQKNLKDMEKATESGTKATDAQAQAMTNLRQKIQEQKQANTEYSKAIKDTVKGMQDTGKASSDAGNAVKTLAEKLGVSSGAAEAMGSAVNMAIPKLGSLGSTIGSILPQLAAFTAAAAAIGKVLSAGLEESKAGAHMAAFVGSMEEGREAVELFNATARDMNTDFDEDAINQMGVQLMNMGYSAKNASAMIEICANAAVGLGKGQEQTQQFVDTIGRIQSTGEVSKRQMIALQQSGMDMDKVFGQVGMTSEEAMQAMDDGTLDAQEAVKALTDYMQNEFSGAMDESKQNVIDQWGDLKANCDEIMSAIGGAIFDAFDKSDIIQTLIDFTQDLLDMIQSDGTGTFELFADVGNAALDVISTGLKIVLEAVKAVILGFVKMVNVAREVGKNIWNYLTNLLSPLKWLWDGIKSIAQAVGKDIKGAFTAAADSINADWSTTFNINEDTKVRGIKSLSSEGNHFHTSTRAPKDSSGGSGGGSGSSRSTESKPVEVQVPIGDVVAQAAANSVGMSFNTHDLDETLHEGLGGISSGCAQFASYAAKLAGVEGLNSTLVDDLAAAGRSNGSYHSGDFTGAQKGDLLFWGDSDGFEHVGINDGNGGHWAYNSNSSGGGPGVVHADSNEDYYNVNGYSPMGYLSMSQFTGGKMVAQTMDATQKAAAEAAKKLAEAQKNAAQLMDTLESAITKDTGTTYEAAVDQLDAKVQKYQQDIQKYAAAGVDSESIKNLTDKLAEYQKVMMDKIEKQRQQSMDKLKSDTAKTTNELAGDYKALADAEYKATVDSLNKEKEERFKAVAQNKDDKEAMAQVENWYTAQVQAAAEKRTEAYRDSFSKQVDYAIKAHKGGMLTGLLNSSDAQQSVDWNGQTKAMQGYYELWQDANKSTQEQLVEVAKTAESGFQSFFENLFTGEESFVDSALKLVDTIMESVLQQITQKWAAQLTESLFGGLLNPNGNDNQGGGILGAVAGGILGGGSSGSGTGAGISIGDVTTGVTDGFQALNNTITPLNGALTIMGGVTGKASGLLTGFNAVQGVLNATTKPAEAATTVTTTGAMQMLTASAIQASTALATISATSAAGGWMIFASGGSVVGPGTGTSDSIPARLSNGEYVLNASAVKAIGQDRLDAMNAGQMPQSIVGVPTAVAAPSGGSVTLNVSALDASSFTSFLQRGGLDAIRQALFDNNREFASAAGVW